MEWIFFSRAIRLYRSKSLDLTNLPLPETQEGVSEMWIELGKAVKDLPSLIKVDLGKCTPQAVDIITTACPQLKSLKISTIRGSELDLAYCARCVNLKELKIKSVDGIDLKNFAELKNLKSLKKLALTTIKNLNGIEQALPESLKSLELGECSNLSDIIVTETLPKLTNLKKLRLEKGRENFPLNLLIQTIANLPNLVQLELINFDIRTGFEVAIAQCTNLKTLLLIPTYTNLSATTNHVVKEGVSKLSGSLRCFIWGLTLELIRVTDLFIDQVEQTNRISNAGRHMLNLNEQTSYLSIPILTPLLNHATNGSGTDKEHTGRYVREDGRRRQEGGSVEVIEVSKLEEILTSSMPNTKIKILKVAYKATWRQTVTDFL